MSNKLESPRLEWRQDERGGWRLYAGRWLVGSVYYGAGTQRSESLVWIAACRLPGIKETLGRFIDTTTAKAKVERGVELWFSQLGSLPRAEGAPSREGA